MIIYKVVYKTFDNILVSAKAVGNLKTKYKIGEYVSAPEWAAKEGYHLLAFNDIENAKAFINCSGNKYKIYKADGLEQVPLPSMCYIDTLLSCKIFDPIEHPLIMWPKGTVMFKKIKLLEEVE